MSPFFRAVFEYLLAPEGTHSTLMIPPLDKASAKTLNGESAKISDTCSSNEKNLSVANLEESLIHTNYTIPVNNIVAEFRTGNGAFKTKNG